LKAFKNNNELFDVLATYQGIPYTDPFSGILTNINKMSTVGLPLRNYQDAVNSKTFV
jgi:hypothetical protein